MLGQHWIPGGNVPHPRRAHYLTLNVDVVLHEVVDLTDVHAAQASLQTNVQELTGDWDCYAVRSSITPVFDPNGITPTQELGMQLFLTSGIEAFQTVSARVPYHRNIVIFPQKLHPGSFIAFRDPRNPGGPPIHRIP